MNTRPTFRKAYVTHYHGPCIVARVKDTDPGSCAILTWDGKCIWVYDYELLPFPLKAGATKGTKVPDYDVRGVSEIVALEAELNEDHRSHRGRVKSRLHAPFCKIERDGEL
jgi:hypothetical protein